MSCNFSDKGLHTHRLLGGSFCLHTLFIARGWGPGASEVYRAVGEPCPGRRASVSVVDTGLYWTLPVFLVAKVRIRLLTCPGTQSPHLGCWARQLGKETHVWLSVQGPHKVQHSEEGEEYKETCLKEDWVGSASRSIQSGDQDRVLSISLEGP